MEIIRADTDPSCRHHAVVFSISRATLSCPPYPVASHLNLDFPSPLVGQDVDLDGLIAFQHVANYLSAAQIFLADNALLTRELRKEDIKKRLLGHWGTW